jgi:hypothetical protein
VVRCVWTLDADLLPAARAPAPSLSCCCSTCACGSAARHLTLRADAAALLRRCLSVLQ